MGATRVLKNYHSIILTVKNMGGHLYLEISLPSLQVLAYVAPETFEKVRKILIASITFLLLDFYHLILTTKRALNCFLNIYLENLRVKFLDNQVIKPGNLLNVLCLTS